MVGCTPGILFLPAFKYSNDWVGWNNKLARIFMDERLRKNKVDLNKAYCIVPSDEFLMQKQCIRIFIHR